MKLTITADLPFEWCATCFARDLKNEKNVFMSGGDRYITLENLICIHAEMCEQVYEAQKKLAKDKAEKKKESKDEL